MTTEELHYCKRWFSSREDAQVRVRGQMLIAVIERKCLELGEKQLCEAKPMLEIPEGPNVLRKMQEQLYRYALRKFGTLNKSAAWLGVDHQAFSKRVSRAGMRKENGRWI